jgi:DNA-binding PadR family transcriptional regulator
MASPRIGEVSAGKAVLGLLVQRADTAAGVGVRLEQEYPAARWPRSIVHNTLPELAAHGLVQVARRGPERALDLYEATPGGADHIASWLRESTVVIPAIRDATRAKLRCLQDEEQLATIVGDIREQEDLCAREGERAMLRYQAARGAGHLGRAEMPEWQRRVRLALMLDEATFFLHRARALQRLQRHLQEPEMGSEALALDD